MFFIHYEPSLDFHVQISAYLSTLKLPEPCGLVSTTRRRPRATLGKKAHLVELLPADGAVLLVAQHPHLGGAAVTNRVVAFSQGEDIYFLAAQDAVLLCFFCGC